MVSYSCVLKSVFAVFTPLELVGILLERHKPDNDTSGCVCSNIQHKNMDLIQDQLRLTHRLNAVRVGVSLAYFLEFL